MVVVVDDVAVMIVIAVSVCSLFVFLLQKDSELLPLMGYYNAKMHQAGVLGFTNHLWLGHRRPADDCGCKAAREAGGAAIPLGYANTLLPFVFFAGGAAAAMVGAVLEWGFGVVKKV